MTNRLRTAACGDRARTPGAMTLGRGCTGGRAGRQLRQQDRSPSTWQHHRRHLRPDGPAGRAPPRQHLPGHATVIAETCPAPARCAPPTTSPTSRQERHRARPRQRDPGVEQALRNAAVQFDAAKLTWIGRVAASNAVHIQWHTSKVQSIEDAKNFEADVAGTGPGNVAEIVPNLLNAVIGTKSRSSAAIRPPTSPCSRWNAARSKAPPSTGRR